MIKNRERKVVEPLSHYRMKMIVGIILGIVSLTGCAGYSLPITSGIGSSEIQLGAQYSKYLIIDNDELAQRLYITDVKSRQQNGLLNINVNLQSHYARSQKLQYQFQWFDSQGFAVEVGKAPWQALELHGKQFSSLQAVAPNEQVTSFRIYVREIPEKAYKY